MRHAGACVPCFQTLQQHRVSNRLLQRVFSKARDAKTTVSPLSPHRLVTKRHILSKKEELPVCQSVVARSIAALNDPNVNLDKVSAIVSEDPVIATHLLAAANAALVSTSEVRSLKAAVARLGFDRLKLHILGSSLKSTFVAPHLRPLWNHSIQIASISRDLAELTRVINPETACLAGLVHDIGSVLLAQLGPIYEKHSAKLKELGMFPVEAERHLFDSDHADVGADLLSSLSFPPDLVESVRYHHAPLCSELPLTAILYTSEVVADSEEDYCHGNEHKLALKRLGLAPGSLRSVGLNLHPDLRTLQVAA